MNIGKTAAIVLAAGQGKRMQAGQPKQFMLLGGRPVLYYALAAFEKSEVDEIILVTGADEIDYCRAEIVEHYGFRKVTQIIPGGKERYHSVACGLRALKQSGCDIVLIHDGARPFVTEEMIRQMIAEAMASFETKVYHACVTGTLVKDTIKIADEEGFCATTPDRKRVWAVQTPQSFSYPLVLDAYEKLLEQENKLLQAGVSITDDAMVVERMTSQKVKLVEGSYRNIKLTTPEDMIVCESYLRE